MTRISEKYPICVDLDGTFIYNDVTQIAIRKFVKKNYLNTVKILFWFLRGRAFLKKQLAQKVDLDIADLKINNTVLNMLKEYKKSGYKIYLATACSDIYAKFVISHFSVFDGYFASDGHINLRAYAKAKKLINVFGEKNFIYFGNSHDDLKVWNHAHFCVAVNIAEKTFNKLTKNRSSNSIIRIK